MSLYHKLEFLQSDDVNDQDPDPDPDPLDPQEFGFLDPEPRILRSNWAKLPNQKLQQKKSFYFQNPNLNKFEKRETIKISWSQYLA